MSDRAKFDRIRSPSERLARNPRGTDLDASQHRVGRGSLFTHGRTDAGHGALLSVVCSRCGVRSDLDRRQALRSAVPLILVAPWKRHPVFAVCPACRHRAWLRLAVRG